MIVPILVNASVMYISTGFLQGGNHQFVVGTEPHVADHCFNRTWVVRCFKFTLYILVVRTKMAITVRQVESSPTLPP